jgi:glyoxylase-like metal-dependent hydrolase (beta-lactamase superfamily II)
MKRLADGLYQLRGFPPNAINVYLADDVLIDAATRQAERRILRQLQGYHVDAHALTHVHPDHQGSSHTICQRLSIPLWCGEQDVAAMETPGAVVGAKVPRWLRRFQERWWVGAPHLIDRQLKEGDKVASFKVIETPGHTAGHIAFWRESDRVLIAGDVLNNINFFTGLPSLREPPDIFTADIERNRESIRKLAALEPRLTCFGHGAPRRNADKLKRLAEKIPK